jgi:methylglyoxal synthase
MGDAMAKAAKRLRVGMVAHDERKAELARWLAKHRKIFMQAEIVATGTTAKLLRKRCPELSIDALASGPLGGDQQMGALIADGALGALFFFWDPLTPMPHDVDVRALLRLATLYDLPHACNLATADLIAAGLARGTVGA